LLPIVSIKKIIFIFSGLGVILPEQPLNQPGWIQAVTAALLVQFFGKGGAGFSLHEIAGVCSGLS